MPAVPTYATPTSIELASEACHPQDLQSLSFLHRCGVVTQFFEPGEDLFEACLAVADVAEARKAAGTGTSDASGETAAETTAEGGEPQSGATNGA